MTRCPKDQADLFLDSTYWCFDTLAEALLARERLADLAGARWLHWDATQRRLKAATVPTAPPRAADEELPLLA
jgi:hypothetical protein